MRINLEQRFIASLLATILLVSTTAIAAPPPGKGKGGGDDGGGSTTAPQYSWTWLPTQGASKISNRGDILAYHQLAISDGNGGVTLVDFRQLLIDEGWIDAYDEATQSGVQTNDVRLNDLNLARQVTGGITEYVSGQRVDHAFFYQPGTDDFQVSQASLLLILDVIHANFSDHVALNELGEFAGAGVDPNNPGAGKQIYVGDQENGLTWLGSPDLYGYEFSVFDNVEAINAFGEICGSRSTLYPWRYTPSLGFTGIESKGKPIVGDSSYARDMNEAGQITGVYQLGDYRYDQLPFRADPDGNTIMIKFPKNGRGWGRAINAAGDVLGLGDLDTAGNIWRPFLYTDRDGLVDLMANVVDLPAAIDPANPDVEPYDINDEGQIVGRDRVTDAGFLLTPIQR